MASEDDSLHPFDGKKHEAHEAFHRYDKTNFKLSREYTLVAQVSFPNYHCSTFSMVPIFCGNCHGLSSKYDCLKRY